jgi:hypothetical protein
MSPLMSARPLLFAEAEAEMGWLAFSRACAVIREVTGKAE